MLSETWQLWRALERAGIPIDRPHPLIKPLPTATVLRIRLDANGHVSAVEDVINDERIGLRRIVQTSDGSFPVLKMNQPILCIDSKVAVWTDMKKAIAPSAKIDLLARCVARYPKRSWSDAGHSWTQSREKGDLLIRNLDRDTNCKAIVSLARRFQTALNDDVMLTDSIARTVVAALQQDRLSNVAAAVELLLGKGKDTNGDDKKISVLLVLDLDQTPANVLPVYHEKTWRRVASILPMNLSATKREHKHRTNTCAFGGHGPLLTGPFPQVKLPVLGRYFPLVSMASDGDKAKCNKRYGLTEYTVVPVSQQAALQMTGALKWILAENREGRTWRGVSNGQFEKDPRTGKKREERDLLIAFVEDRPEVHAKTASYFGSGQDVIETQFEIDARAIAAAFNADPQVRPQSKLNFFLIHKASDGQAKVALAESPTVQEILNAAEWWVEAAKKKVPHVRLWLPKETRNSKTLNAIEGQPLPPYPDQVVRLLSYQWIRDGSSPKSPGGRQQKAYHEVIGPGLGEVLSLMLHTEGKWEPTIRQLLTLLIQRLSPLLIGIFGAKHAYGPRRNQKKPEPLDDYPRSSCETALRAVAVAAILLDALEERKEHYMNNAPFQVGQVLALADTLHKDYCTVVRKSQLPNSLIGTALMRRALDNPASAIADLGERMMEYVRWAKTAEEPHGADKERERIAVREARKKLRQYQPLAVALGSADLPTELCEADKAKLLLGFLASPPDDDREHEGKDGDK